MQRSNLPEWKNGKMLELISMEMVFQRCLELRILCLEPGNEMRSFVCSYEDVVVVLQKVVILSTLDYDNSTPHFPGFFSELHKTEGDDTFGPRL